MEYVVLASRWSDKEQKNVTYIAGRFDKHVNAIIFKTAYIEYYKKNAIIVEVNCD